MYLREALGIEVLHGCNTDILEPPSSVVRMFISSTISGWGFTDELFFTVACHFITVALKAFSFT